MYETAFVVTIVDYVFVPLNDNSIYRIATTDTYLILPLTTTSCDTQDGKQ